MLRWRETEAKSSRAATLSSAPAAEPSADSFFSLSLYECSSSRWPSLVLIVAIPLASPPRLCSASAPPATDARPALAAPPRVRYTTILALRLGVLFHAIMLSRFRALQIGGNSRTEVCCLPNPTHKPQDLLSLHPSSFGHLILVLRAAAGRSGSLSSDDATMPAVCSWNTASLARTLGPSASSSRKSHPGIKLAAATNKILPTLSLSLSASAAPSFDRSRPGIRKCKEGKTAPPPRPTRLDSHR